MPGNAGPTTNEFCWHVGASAGTTANMQVKSTGLLVSCTVGTTSDKILPYSEKPIFHALHAFFNKSEQLAYV